VMSFLLDQTRVTSICRKVMTLQAASKDVDDDIDNKLQCFC
jgi:hypothetical protein